mmetsp:Transcript_28913/g.66855  ORF Transcript_28913/g.66855 Transcript_28913/m.66855 type:complete len:241 (+) Transcript_28913:755-1477(+)
MLNTRRKTPWKAKSRTWASSPTTHTWLIWLRTSLRTCLTISWGIWTWVSKTIPILKQHRLLSPLGTSRRKVVRRARAQALSLVLLLRISMRPSPRSTCRTTAGTSKHRPLVPSLRRRRLPTLSFTASSPGEAQSTLRATTAPSQLSAGTPPRPTTSKPTLLSSRMARTLSRTTLLTRLSVSRTRAARTRPGPRLATRRRDSTRRATRPAPTPGGRRLSTTRTTAPASSARPARTPTGARV